REAPADGHSDGPRAGRDRARRSAAERARFRIRRRQDQEEPYGQRQGAEAPDAARDHDRARPRPIAGATRRRRRLRRGTLPLPDRAQPSRPARTVARAALVALTAADRGSYDGQLSTVRELSQRSTTRPPVIITLNGEEREVPDSLTVAAL